MVFEENQNNPLLKEAADLGVKIEIISGKNRIFKFIALLSYLKCLRGSKIYVLYFCQFYINVKFSIFISWLKRSKVRLYVIFAERNHFDELKYIGYLKRNIFKILIRLFYSKVDCVIFNSLQSSIDFTATYKCKSTHIYNPRIDTFTRAAVNITKSNVEKPVILNVGRHSIQKDISTLLIGFSKLRQKKDATLILIGEGPETSRLKLQARQLGINKDVHFLGPLNSTEVNKWYRRADLFVLSSLYEGLPNVLIESVGAGCRAISSDCRSGPSEILQNPSLLFPIQDADALCEKIKWALSADQSIWRSIDLEKFTSHKVSNRYEELLVSIEQDAV